MKSIFVIDRSCYAIIARVVEVPVPDDLYAKAFAEGSKVLLLPKTPKGVYVRRLQRDNIFSDKAEAVAELKKRLIKELDEETERYNERSKKFANSLSGSEEVVLCPME